MIEENNRKGPGVFYAVVGVATLVVAIIGATFAYFSAQANAKGEKITGGTNDALASSLAVTVHEVKFEGISEEGENAISHKLVPAKFTNMGADITPADITAAITAKCVNAGYTGCHIWKIDAAVKQRLANTNILLDLSTDAATKTNWSYAIFTADALNANGTSTNVKIAQVGTTADGTTYTNDQTGAGTLATAISKMDIHNNKAMEVGAFDDNGVTTPSNTYYLMVYLANTADAQNEKGETGTYTGTVSMQAAGGKVSATFTA